MKIQSLEIPGKTFLAPLAGITNLPFRRLVKECGCAVVCSEMVSAKGIFYHSAKTLTLLETDERERPLSVQIFGAEPESMGRAARFIQDRGCADILDINFGCSVKKVVKQGAGAALMKDPATSRSVIRAVRQSTTLPLTLKIRSGWDPSGRQAFALVRMAEDEGVDAVAFHPRTAGQLFRGRADWRLIAQLKERTDLPVIGNGDINSVEDAVAMMDQTGCDAVMIGRAAMANPFLLSQVDSFIETGTYSPPEFCDIFQKMDRLIHLYVAYFGETTACKMLRGRLSWFVKGMPGCVAFRRKLSLLQSKNQALDLINDFRIRVLN